MKQKRPMGRPPVAAETHRRRNTFRADRHSRVKGTEALNPVFLFIHSRDGLDPHIGGYKSRDKAWPVWDKYRRQVWAETLVGCLPGAAGSYDGLTQESSWSFQRVWGWIRFDHEPVQAGLDRDRAAVAAFRQRHPKGAKGIADFLDRWLEHLDRLETHSRGLHGHVGPREWPIVSARATYREAAKRK